MRQVSAAATRTGSSGIGQSRARVWREGLRAIKSRSAFTIFCEADEEEVGVEEEGVRVVLELAGVVAEKEVVDDDNAVVVVEMGGGRGEDEGVTALLLLLLLLPLLEFVGVIAVNAEGEEEVAANERTGNET